MPAGTARQTILALAYRANMVERDLSANTVNRRLAAIGRWSSWPERSGWSIGRSTWATSRRGPIATRPVAAPRATAGCSNTSTGAGIPKAIRDRAIVRLLFERALRRNEVASLDVEHVALDAATISVRGKGHTDRECLTLAEPTRRALADWLAIRGGEPGPLFTNFDRARKGNGRLTGAGIWAIVTALGEATGQTVRPHGLRHAAITEALDRTNGDVRAVQQFSRHAKVETLLVYDDARRDFGGDVAKLVARE